MDEDLSLHFHELVVGVEYDVQWDDNSSTEGSFRAVLVKKGGGATLWSNGVLIRGGSGVSSIPSPFCYCAPEGSDPHDPHLLEMLNVQ